MSTECPCPGSLQIPWLIQLEPSREGIPQDLKPPFRGVRGWLGSAGGTDWGGGPGDKNTSSSRAQFWLCLYRGWGCFVRSRAPSRGCVPGRVPGLHSGRSCPAPSSAATCRYCGCENGGGTGRRKPRKGPGEGRGELGNQQPERAREGKSRECLQPRSVSSAQLPVCPVVPVSSGVSNPGAAWGGSVTPRTAPGWIDRGVSVITRV